jgi:H+/gluconate symporter-like permease
VVHEIVIITLLSTLIGLLIGVSYVPYAQAMLVASGVGLVTGISLCAFISAALQSGLVKRVRGWKRK